MFKALGKIVVAAAGTKVALFAGTPNLKGTTLVLSAPATNTNLIYIGDLNLNKATGAGVGFTLAPGAVIVIPCNGQFLNPEQIFVDADTNGNAVYAALIS